MTRTILVLIATLCALLATPRASAKWYEASGDHFVIYADDSEEEVRRFAENLERYHSALVVMRKLGDDAPPSPSNRVTIFVVDSKGDVGRLVGDRSGQIAGFYIPRAGGSVAFTQPIRKSDSDQPNLSQLVLLHEYAHHYLISNVSFAFPRWYAEGFAEFFGTSTFGEDGSVGLGKPSALRAREMAYARSIPWSVLLDSRAYAERKGKERDSFYGQSWATFHYLQVTPEGQAMHMEFLKRLLNGEPDVDAAEAAFGDLGKFGKTVRKHRRQRRLPYFVIEPEQLSVGSVTLRALSAGEAEAMAVRMVSRRGVTLEEAIELVPEAREVAAKYPDDAAVLAVLAEAEYDAENLNEAIAAADRALAIDPKHIAASLQKGYALFDQAGESDNPDEAWPAVRKHFLAINAIENDHPVPLIYFYRSYEEQGREPTANAKAALDWALQLSPFDQGLRLMVARQDMKDGRYAEARLRLLPLAFDPHGNSDGEGPVFDLLQEAEVQLGMREAEDGAETQPAANH